MNVKARWYQVPGAGAKATVTSPAVPTGAATPAWRSPESTQNWNEFPVPIPKVLETSICVVAVVGNWNQPSTVRLAGCRDRESGALTYAPVPLNWKALPTLPAPVVAPPCSVPLFGPALSTALPSARYQSIRFDGGDVQRLDAVSVTLVALFASVKVPPGYVRLLAAKNPDEDPNVRTVKEVPEAGVYPPVVVAASVPPRAKAPGTLMTPKAEALAIGKESVPDCVSEFGKLMVPVEAMIVPEAWLFTMRPIPEVPVPAVF